jgi:predicted ribosome quality control (RQC) complex YloA/Tae2 family protein
VNADGRRRAPRRDDPVPPRLFEFTLPGGWLVLAGRTDRDNDRLSLKLARPDDWWFHVRGLSGSHVVLKGPAGCDPDRNILEQAAAVAAWYSKKRTSRRVAVSYTRARYVTKPRGAEPGTVAIRKEKVLQVTPRLPESPTDRERT